MQKIVLVRHAARQLARPSGHLHPRRAQPGLVQPDQHRRGLGRRASRAPHRTIEQLGGAMSALAADPVDARPQHAQLVAQRVAVATRRLHQPPAHACRQGRGRRSTRAKPRLWSGCRKLTVSTTPLCGPAKAATTACLATSTATTTTGSVSLPSTTADRISLVHVPSGQGGAAVQGACVMPTVLRIGPYRFYFYSHEPNEPSHIHVDRDDLSAKF